MIAGLLLPLDPLEAYVVRGCAGHVRHFSRGCGHGRSRPCGRRNGPSPRVDPARDQGCGGVAAGYRDRPSEGPSAGLAAKVFPCPPAEVVY
jgi:hypothetical protein